MTNKFEEIYHNGTYLANNPGWGRQDAAWKAAVIFELLQKNNIPPKEIIDLGCGSGEILRKLNDKFTSPVSARGYDISSAAINLARENESVSTQFFNEDYLVKNLHTDLLLVIDVLEHVPDFYSFLSKIKPRANHFVFHIPLDLSVRSILKPHIMLQQRKAVGHLHYFTKEMVEWMLTDSNFKIIDWVYTKPHLDTMPAKTAKDKLKKILRNFSFSINKNLSAKAWGNYSMMILAK